MVAAIPPKDPPSSALRRAHELVAATLLDGDPAGEGPSEIVPSSPGKHKTRCEASAVPLAWKWQAWIFTAWVAVLAAAFLVYLLHAL